MSKLFFSFALLLLTSLSGWSQNLSFDEWRIYGDSAFAKKDHYAAFKYYEAALKFDTTRLDLWWRLAESARQFNAYPYAEEGYRQLIRQDQFAEFSEARFWLGDILQSSGRYREAIAQYEEFLEDFPNADPALRQAAEKGIADSRFALQQLESQPAAPPELTHLSGQINSIYSDFSPLQRGDTLFYSSLQYHDRRDEVSPRRLFSRIMISVDGEKGKELSRVLNERARHASNPAFSLDGRRIYYTLCDYVDYERDVNAVRCDIYFRERTAEGDWGPKNKLSINYPSYSSTQISIGRDAVTGQELLFFASDRPGGEGGMDIWVSTLDEQGQAGEPLNLGPVINTTADENTPYFHTPSQQLYFSSKGHERLGGLDIYRSQRRSDGWSEPGHLPMPYNSSYDDAYFSLNAEGTLAYLASNRPESAFIEEEKEACCYDLYSGPAPTDPMVNLLVTTINGLDRSVLPGATVTVKLLDPDGDRTLRTLTNETGNEFPFQVQPVRRYLITGVLPGFGEVTREIDLSQPQWEGKIDIEVELEFYPPGITLEAFTYRSLNNTDLDSATVELYELGRFGEILVDSRSNNEGNDFTFNLDIGKQYRLQALRQGYTPKTEDVDLSDPTMVGRSPIRRDIYLDPELLVFTFDHLDETPLSGVRIRYYEMTQPDRTLVSERTNEFSNDFRFPFDGTKTYLIEADKAGYDLLVDTLVFTPEELASIRDNPAIELYLRRVNFDDFLPLALYFDNNTPDPGSNRPTTQTDYSQVYEEYYGRKQEYINAFTGGEALTEEERFLTTELFDNFFEREVRGGGRDLDTLSQKLLAYLDNGRSLELELKGYASPRGSEAYNLILSRRRVDCVRNYFERYQNGAFRRHLNSGALTITTQAYGEATVDVSKVSDNLQDEKNSIFSILASVERRVEIVEVRTDNASNDN